MEKKVIWREEDRKAFIWQDGNMDMSWGYEGEGWWYKKSNWRRIFPMELGNKGEEDVVKIENR